MKLLIAALAFAALTSAATAGYYSGGKYCYTSGSATICK